ncbi:MAG: PTS sugar transporter subunit IIA [Victivallales bacterium]|nr:PTS sugar transporter subunit IIA [Victivallales bacterium]
MEDSSADRFHNYVAEGNVICGITSKQSESAIDELLRLLAKNTTCLDSKSAKDALLEREKVMPTMVSPGLAVPHARLPDIKQIIVALGTSEQGIDFKSAMGPAHVVALILTPKDDPGMHLQILAALARDLSEPGTIKRIASFKKSAELLRFLSGYESELPDFVSAKNILNPKPVMLREADTLETAIKAFATNRVLDIPVVDEEMDVLGVLSLEDILRLSLPEHLLWLEDLSPILHFQPFADMLRNDRDTKVADCMREDFIKVEEDVPAVQLAKLFLINNARRIIVTRNGKFAGVVDIQDFTTQLFWV